MSDDRRSAHRARLSGVRVIYEGATGERLEADVLDLSTGGLFIRTARPIAIGKRISVEVHVIGEPAPWTALGRVVWTRESGGENQSPGMGIKLIDVDDAVVEAIGRMVDARERTEPGLGRGTLPPVERLPATPAPAITSASAAPEAAPPDGLSREKTILGVGEPTAGDADPVAPAPVVIVTAPSPSLESSPPPPAAARTVPLNIAGLKPAPKNPASARPSPSPAASPPVAVAAARAVDPPATPRKGSGGVVFLLILIVAAATAYGFRGDIRARLFPSAEAPAAPAPAPPPPPSDAPPAASSGAGTPGASSTLTAPPASVSAPSPAPSASASASSAPSASASASAHPAAPPWLTASSAGRHPLPAPPPAPPNAPPPTRKPRPADEGNPY